MIRKRIGLDVRLTRQMSAGMQAYARELPARLPRVAPEMELILFREGANFSWEEQVRLPRAIRNSHLDLTHFFSQYAPALAPRPFVITIHDLIHLRFPQYFKKRVGPYYRTVVRWLCARAEKIITDDQRTVADLQRYLGVDPGKVRVVPLGVDDRFLAPIAQYERDRPYFLYVGNHREHKDLPTLFAAWSGLPQEIDVDLYVTGPDDFGGTLARYESGRRRIAALGDLPPERVPALYAGAIALVHPALCEGFGLPMLEAMAARCPVIASEEAIPSVLRSAALLFAPGDVEGARSAMRLMLEDAARRASVIEEGRAKAERLTWTRCAIETADVYREVLKEAG